MTQVCNIPSNLAESVTNELTVLRVLPALALKQTFRSSHTELFSKDEDLIQILNPQGILRIIRICAQQSHWSLPLHATMLSIAYNQILRTGKIIEELTSCVDSHPVLHRTLPKQSYASYINTQRLAYAQTCLQHTKQAGKSKTHVEDQRHQVKWTNSFHLLCAVQQHLPIWFISLLCLQCMHPPLCLNEPTFDSMLEFQALHNLIAW